MNECVMIGGCNDKSDVDSGKSLMMEWDKDKIFYFERVAWLVEGLPQFGPGEILRSYIKWPHGPHHIILDNENSWPTFRQNYRIYIYIPNRPGCRKLQNMNSYCA